MGCTDSKEKLPKPCVAPAARSGVRGSAVCELKGAPYTASVGLAAPSFSVSNAEVGDSCSRPLWVQHPDRHHLHGRIQGLSTARVDESLPRVKSDTAHTDGGISLFPPATLSRVLPPAASASPPSSQYAPLKVGMRGSFSGERTRSAPQHYDVDDEVTQDPQHLKYTPLFAASQRTTTSVYADTPPLTALRSLGSANHQLDSADESRAASLQCASKIHTTSSVELEQGVRRSGVHPVHIHTLGDDSTPGRTLPSSVNSPPALEQQLVSRHAAQETPPSRSTTSVTKPSVVRAAVAYRDPNQRPPESLPGNTSPVEHHCRPCLPSPEGELFDPKANTRRRGPFSDRVDNSPRTPVQLFPASQSSPGASHIDGARDQGCGSMSRESPPAQSSKQQSARPVTPLRSISLPSQSPTAVQQALLTDVEMPPEPPHGSCSLSPYMLSHQPAASRTSSLAMNVSADITALVSVDAPDDVPLPQTFEDVAWLHTRGGAGGGSARALCLSMPNPSDTRRCVTQRQIKSPTIAPSPRLPFEAVGDTSPSTSPLDVVKHSAHHHADSGHAWSMNGVNSVEGGGSGHFVAGGRRDGVSTCLPTPPNWEVFRRIRQPTTGLRSILRTSGGNTTGTCGAMVGKDGAAPRTGSSTALPLIANGSKGNCRPHASADFICRKLFSGGPANGDAGGISDVWRMAAQSPLRRDFIVRGSTTRPPTASLEAECLSSKHAPAAASVLASVVRSLMPNGYSEGISKPSELNTSIAANSSNTLVYIAGGSGDQGAGGTLLLLQDQCSSGSPQLISFSSPVPAHLLLHDTQPRRGTAAIGAGNSSLDDNKASVLSPLLEVRLSPAHAPEVLTNSCSIDDPPPDIMLTSTRKRVHVIA